MPKVTLKDKVFLTLTLLFLANLLSSCQKQPEQRNYQEIVVESPLEKITPKMNLSNLPPGHPDIGQMSKTVSPTLPVSVDFKWDVPEGWIEKAGEGMRLVTFTAQDTYPIECSIVSLGGMAGGLEANIRRWMGQINIPEISSEDLNAFLQKQEKITSQGGLSMTIIDFTQLQENGPQDVPSMIAGILTIQDKTTFIKMTGAKMAVQFQEKNFKQLCASFKLKNESSQRQN